MLYFIFNDEVFHADQLYSVVMENMPFNRKYCYYPHYFYENKSLLCSTELKTTDSNLDCVFVTIIFFKDFVRKNKAVEVVSADK